MIEFIESYCVFPDGALEEQPAELMPWWREAMFELYRLRDDGSRQYRRAYISVPKKNMKTLGAAWLGLYHTTADTEPTPLVVAAAAGDDQADLAFTAATRTAELGNAARDVLEGASMNLRDLTERWESEILVPTRPGARLRRVASGGGNLDGPNIYVCIIDELHEWRTQRNLDTHRVLSQGGTQRDQPLFIQITTAGWDRESLCYRVYLHAKAVQQDQSVDPYLFALIYEAPEDCDHTDREAWEAANPAAGYSVTFERYLEDLNDPEMTEAVARRYRLNQWTDTEEIWLPKTWAEYAWPADERRMPRPTDAAQNIRTVAGLDASTRRDSTAITVWELTGPRDDLEVRSWSRVWDRPRKFDGAFDESWKIPQQQIKAHLYSLHFGTLTGADDAFWCELGVCACGCGWSIAPLHLVGIGYDPSRITMQADAWEADGLPMIEVPQTDSRMVPAFQLWFELLDEDRYQHDGSAAVAQHVANSQIRDASSGGRRLDRKRSGTRLPNDAAITQVICASVAETQEDPEGPSVYETRGIRRLGE